MTRRKDEVAFDPVPVLNRWFAAVSAAAKANKPMYIIWLFVITLSVCASMMYLNGGNPSVSDVKFLGLPLYETGDVAVAWVACGNSFSIGLFAFGGIAVGVVAIGGCSFGIYSLGGVAIGLLLAFGGCAMGYYCMGGCCLGAFAYSGHGVALGYFLAEGSQKEELLFEKKSKMRKTVPKKGEWMFGFLKSLFSGFSMPQPSGPPELVQQIAPGAPLISSDASWKGNQIVVKCSEPGTYRLLEIPLGNVDKCMLGLRFQMSSMDLKNGGYPEMWVKVEGFGEAFSKGLNFRLKGTNSETRCELPFYLKQGQQGTNLKFNLTFEGAGQITVQGIELYSTPL